MVSRRASARTGRRHISGGAPPRTPPQRKTLSCTVPHTAARLARVAPHRCSTLRPARESTSFHAYALAPFTPIKSTAPALAAARSHTHASQTQRCTTNLSRAAHAAAASLIVSGLAAGGALKRAATPDACSRHSSPSSTLSSSPVCFPSLCLPLHRRCSSSDSPALGGRRGRRCRRLGRALRRVATTALAAAGVTLIDLLGESERAETLVRVVELRVVGGTGVED